VVYRSARHTHTAKLTERRRRLAAQDELGLTVGGPDILYAVTSAFALEFPVPRGQATLGLEALYSTWRSTTLRPWRSAMWTDAPAHQMLVSATQM